MAKTSYDTLAAMYHRLVAAHKMLQEEIREKEEFWAAKEKEYNYINSKMRALCEMIVVKMPLNDCIGRAFSWNSVDNEELLSKAKNAFIQYNAQRTKEINELVTMVQDLQTTNENLQLQVNGLMSRTDIKEEDEGVEDDPGEKPKPMPNNRKIQDAANDGDLDVELIEDDDDITDDDLRHDGEMQEMGQEVALKKGDPKVRFSQRTIDMRHKISENQQKAIMVDADQIREEMNDQRWEIIKIIGETGEFAPKEIYQAMYGADLDKASNVDDNKFRGNLFTLSTLQVLRKQHITLPLAPRFHMYALDTIGEIFYREKFGKEPCPSKAVQIIKDHDNLEHGLGIMSLAETLQMIPYAEKITTERDINTVKLPSGDCYVPDVVVKTSKYVSYYEYERGLHHTATMKIKLNKMAVASRYLNIITANKSACDDVHQQVKEWIKSRGGIGFLPKHTVRIATLQKFAAALKAGARVNDPTTWNYYYDLGGQSVKGG